MVAYADDVTIFVTSPADIQLIQEALTCYQAASEARLNIEKSKAMAIGSWDISTDIMGIQYHTDINIMGVRMHNTVSQSVNNSRTAVTGKIRAQARDAYNRELPGSTSPIHTQLLTSEGMVYSADISAP